MKKQLKEVAGDKRVRWFLLRLLPAWVIFSALFYVAGVYYARLYMPALFYQIRFTHPEYEIHKLELNSNSCNIETTVHRRLTDENGKEWAGKRVEGSTGTSDFYICPIIVFSLVFAWPGLKLRKRLLAFALTLPLIYLAGMADVPSRLIYQVEWMYVEGSPPGAFRRFWQLFIMNGGRQFLAIVIAVTVLVPMRRKSLLANC